MNFIHTDFEVTGPSIAIVTLQHQANVMLLRSMHYEAYCARRLFLYDDGGWSTRSPVRLKIPDAGPWHIVVDLYGAPGRISATIEVVDARSKHPGLRRRSVKVLPRLTTPGALAAVEEQRLAGQLAPRRDVIAVVPKTPRRAPRGQAKKKKLKDEPKKQTAAAAKKPKALRATRKRTNKAEG